MDGAGLDHGERGQCLLEDSSSSHGGDSIRQARCSEFPRDRARHVASILPWLPKYWGLLQRDRPRSGRTAGQHLVGLQDEAGAPFLAWSFLAAPLVEYCLPWLQVGSDALRSSCARSPTFRCAHRILLPQVRPRLLDLGQVRGARMSDLEKAHAGGASWGVQQ